MGLCSMSEMGSGVAARVFTEESKLPEWEFADYHLIWSYKFQITAAP